MKIENKSSNGAFARDLLNVLARYGTVAFSIDVNSFSIAVDQPAELNTVRDPLIHFCFGLLETIRRGENFDHKLGRKPQVFRAFLFGQPLEGFVRDPGCIRR